MKIKVKQKKDKTKPEYPKLMQCNFSNDYYMIVLFRKYETGTVVDSNCSEYEIGYYSNNWDMDDFKNFEDKLVLSN